MPGYEETQLERNAFNFVSGNLEKGECRVAVEAQITSSANWTNGGSAAKGLVRPRLHDRQGSSAYQGGCRNQYVK